MPAVSSAGEHVLDCFCPAGRLERGTPGQLFDRAAAREPQCLEPDAGVRAPQVPGGSRRLLPSGRPDVGGNHQETTAAFGRVSVIVSRRKLVRLAAPAKATDMDRPRTVPGRLDSLPRIPVAP